MTTQFPNSTQSGDDLLVPLQEILRGVNVLPAPGDVTATSGTPASVAILEAGATALSKGWAAAAGALGGVGAVGGAIAGFWKTAAIPVRDHIITASGLVLVAALIAVAIIVAMDVYGRAQAAVAQYEARRQLTTARLAVAQQSLPPGKGPGWAPTTLASALMALAGAGKQAAATKTAGAEPGHLRGIRTDETSGLLFRFDGVGADQNDWVPATDLATFEFTH